MKKRIISIILVIAMVLSMIPSVFATTPSDGNNDKVINYVSLGDSMTNGYGLTGYEPDGTITGFNGYLQVAPEAYPAKLAAYLAGYTGDIAVGQTVYEGTNGTVNLTQLAMSGMRPEDLLFALNYDTENWKPGTMSWEEFKSLGWGDYHTWDEFINSKFRHNYGAWENHTLSYYCTVCEKSYKGTYDKGYSLPADQWDVCEHVCAWGGQVACDHSYHVEDADVVRWVSGYGSYAEVASEDVQYKYVIPYYSYMVDGGDGKLFANEGGSAHFGNGNAATAAEYQAAIKNADVITMCLGNANFGVVMLARMLSANGWMTGFGANDYCINPDGTWTFDISNYDYQDLKATITDPTIRQIAEEAEKLVFNYFGITGYEETKDYATANLVLYTAASYMLSYRAVLDRIAELNPDVEIMIVGNMNAMAGMKMDMGNGEEPIDLTAEMEGIFGLLNDYIAGLATLLNETDADHKDITYYYAEEPTVDVLVNHFRELIDGDNVLRDRFITEITSRVFYMMGGAMPETMPGGIELRSDITRTQVEAYKNGTLYATFAREVEDTLEAQCAGMLGMPLDLTVTAEEIANMINGTDPDAMVIGANTIDAVIAVLAPLYNVPEGYECEYIYPVLVEMLQGDDPVAYIAGKVSGARAYYASLVFSCGAYMAFERAIIDGGESPMLHMSAIEGTADGFDGVFGPIGQALTNGLVDGEAVAAAVAADVAAFAQTEEGYNAIVGIMPNVGNDQNVAAQVAFAMVKCGMTELDKTAETLTAYGTDRYAPGQIVANIEPALYNAMSDPEDEVFPTLLNMFARMIIGTGVGQHPSAEGHVELYNAITTAYDAKHTAGDETSENLAVYAQKFYDFLASDESYTSAEKVDLLKKLYSVIEGTALLTDYPEVETAVEVYAYLDAEGYIDDDQTLQIILCAYGHMLNNDLDSSMMEIAKYVYETLMYNDKLEDDDRLAIIGGTYTIIKNKVGFGSYEKYLNAVEDIIAALDGKVSSEKAFDLVEFVYDRINDGDPSERDIREIIGYIWNTTLAYEKTSSSTSNGAGVASRSGSSSSSSSSLSLADKIAFVKDVFEALKNNEILDTATYPELAAVEKLYDDLTAVDAEGDQIVPNEVLEDILNKVIDVISEADDNDELADLTDSEVITAVAGEIATTLLTDNRIKEENKATIVGSVVDALGEAGMDDVIPGVGGDDESSFDLAVIVALRDRLEAAGYLTPKQQGEIISAVGGVLPTIMAGQQLSNEEMIVIAQQVYDIIFNREDLTDEDKIVILQITYITLDEYGYIDMAIDYVNPYYKDFISQILTEENVELALRCIDAAIDATKNAKDIVDSFSEPEELAAVKTALVMELDATVQTLEATRSIIAEGQLKDIRGMLAAMFTLRDEMNSHISNITKLANVLGITYDLFITNGTNEFCFLAGEIIDEMFSTFLKDVKEAAEDKIGEVIDNIGLSNFDLSEIETVIAQLETTSADIRTQISNLKEYTSADVDAEIEKLEAALGAVESYADKLQKLCDDVEALVAEIATEPELTIEKVKAIVAKAQGIADDALKLVADAKASITILAEIYEEVMPQIVALMDYIEEGSPADNFIDTTDAEIDEIIATIMSGYNDTLDAINTASVNIDGIVNEALGAVCESAATAVAAITDATKVAADEIFGTAVTAIATIKAEATALAHSTDVNIAAAGKQMLTAVMALEQIISETELTEKYNEIDAIVNGITAALGSIESLEDAEGVLADTVIAFEALGDIAVEIYAIAESDALKLVGQIANLVKNDDEIISAAAGSISADAIKAYSVSASAIELAANISMVAVNTAMTAYENAVINAVNETIPVVTKAAEDIGTEVSTVVGIAVNAVETSINRTEIGFTVIKDAFENALYDTTHGEYDSNCNSYYVALGNADYVADLAAALGLDAHQYAQYALSEIANAANADLVTVNFDNGDFNALLNNQVQGLLMGIIKANNELNGLLNSAMGGPAIRDYLANMGIDVDATVVTLDWSKFDEDVLAAKDEILNVAKGILSEQITEPVVYFDLGAELAKPEILGFNPGIVVEIPVYELVVAAVENALYGYFEFAAEFPAILNEIRAIAPDAHVVVTGVSNNIVLPAFITEFVDISAYAQYIDYVVDALNQHLFAYAAINVNTTFVENDSVEGILAALTVTSEDHVWGDWYVSKEPTNDEEGEERRDCQNPGCEHYETREIPKVVKVDPEYTVPTGLTATYGDTLADIELPEGFTWKDATATVGNAGTNTFIAIYTPEDTLHYNTVEVEVSVVVAKANATVTNVPTGLTATYGDTLADIELPEGFTWKDATATVGNAGTNSFTAVYTPADTANYNAVEVEVSVVVAKANATVTNVPTGLTATYGDTLADIELPEGFTWKDATATVGNAGTYTFIAIYTPADTANYNAVEIELTVTIAKANATVTGTPATVGMLIANGTEQVLIQAGTANGGTMVYSLSANGPFSATLPKATNAGTYTVYYKVLGDANHNDTQVKSLSITMYPGKITSDEHLVEDMNVRKIATGTTVGQLLDGINEKAYVTVFNADGTVADSNALAATGMVAKLIVNGQVIDVVTVVVTGDVNGDGKITITDMLAVKYHILEKTALVGAYKSAADTSNDDRVSITDFTQIKYSILGRTSIEAN